MLLSELENLKFDLSDYPESDDRKSLSCKLAQDKNVVINADELQRLGDADFALIIKEGRRKLRKYPLCNTKTAAISKIFLKAHKDSIPETLYKLAERNIDYFMTKGKILSNEISTQELFSQERETGLKQAVASRDKLADADYALVINAKGVKTRLYPIDNEPNCKLASEYFSKHLETIPLHLRHEFAKAVVLKCASQGYGHEIVTDDIRSYCNNELNPSFGLEIMMRKEKLASEKGKEALSALESAAKNGSLIKIANLLYRFDKEVGLDRHYGKSYSDAYQAVFNRSGASQEKLANVSIVGDYSIDPETLAAVPYVGQMQELFSEGDFDAIRSDPAAFEALPTPYKQAIQEQIGGGMPAAPGAM